MLKIVVFKCWNRTRTIPQENNAKNRKFSSAEIKREQELKFNNAKNSSTYSVVEAMMYKTIINYKQKRMINVWRSLLQSCI